MDKIDNRDWIDALRESVDKVEGSDLTSMEMGWKRLEAELDSQPILVPRRRRRALVWMAASSVVAAVAVALVLLVPMMWQTTEELNLVASSADAVKEILPLTEPKIQSDGEDEAIDDRVNIDESKEMDLTARSGQEFLLAQEIYSEDKTVENNEEVVSTVKVEQMSENKADTEDKGGDMEFDRELLLGGSLYADNRSSRVGGLDFSVAMSMGALGGSSMPSMDFNSLPIATYSGSFSRLQAKQTYSSSEVTHRQPISFALFLNKDIYKRFSVEAGLQYSGLVSDVRLENLNSSSVQRLDMLGLPVRLGYSVYDVSGFNFYLQAGGMVEYCMSARVGSEQFEEKSWHFSAGAALGVEYNFLPWMGVYVEPDLSYYFTRTNLSTLRNEQPLTFTTRLGFRFKLFD